MNTGSQCICRNRPGPVVRNNDGPEYHPIELRNRVAASPLIPLSEDEESVNPTGLGICVDAPSTLVNWPMVAYVI